jgi:hypothetical protein
MIAIQMIIIRTVAIYYLIQMIFKILQSQDLLLRIKLQKIIKNVLNYSKHHNFIFPSSKFPYLEKWDITDPNTVASWNHIRKCSHLMHSHFSNQ